jgi:hypothetical protein
VQSAFKQLKKVIISQPILHHFHLARPLTLDTDTSDYAIGTICSQPDDLWILHLLGYVSRKLKDTKLNYDIHDKELLAIMDSLY